MHPEPLIPDRGEFIDALFALRRGGVLVRLSDWSGGTAIDGRAVYTAAEPLTRYGLIDEFDNPDGFPGVHYFRLNAQGRAFADRACAAWRRKPLLERMAARLVG
jgi:hypothetical protein